MSFLSKQSQAFKAGLSEVAKQIPGAAPSNTLKRAAPASPSPSVASNTSVAAGGTPTKKLRRDVGATIYSQPENTGVGTELNTQMVYAVEYLKKQSGKALRLDKILDHLNLDKAAEDVRKQVVDRLRNHPSVAFNADPKSSDIFGGTYEHKPILPGVRDKTSLLGFLQRRTDSSGVQVKDIKDGWPNCEDAIGELEAEHKLLVVRTRKDNHPRIVWLDDPTLANNVDDEFKAKWLKVVLPSTDDIVGKLQDAGQKPTSDDPRLLKPVTVEKAKKTRKARSGGAKTNIHMQHILKDYSEEKAKALAAKR